MDLSSWREKIARDAAGAAWGSASGEDEEEDDGPAVLVEQHTDSAMEPAGPTQERYKDGVVTIGCVGEEVVARTGWAEHLESREAIGSLGSWVSGGCLREVPSLLVDSGLKQVFTHPESQVLCFSNGDRDTQVRA